MARFFLSFFLFLNIKCNELVFSFKEVGLKILMENINHINLDHIHI